MNPASGVTMGQRQATAAARPLKKIWPIYKIDEGKRLVTGIVTAELPDRNGEVCDYASTKPYYQKWSDDLMKATEGRSCGNLREMHQLSAVGVGKAIIFDDDKKTIAMTFKVVDDNAWKKTIEGCYSAYSQGGYYERLWTGKDGLPRYTARPVEISLVDRPALPGATFQFVRANGRVEMRKFAGGLTEG